MSLPRRSGSRRGHREGRRVTARDGRGEGRAGEADHPTRARPRLGPRGELPQGEPEVRTMWNRACFGTILVRDSTIADFTYEVPFASVLGSQRLDDGPRGFEP